MKIARNNNELYYTIIQEFNINVFFLKNQININDFIHINFQFLINSYNFFKE